MPHSRQTKAGLLVATDRVVPDDVVRHQHPLVFRVDLDAQIGFGHTLVFDDDVAAAVHVDARGEAPP
jgi:hypothetical protein